MQAVKISIITINWNNVNGLRQTIESILPQLNSDCEYLIIDGESTDGSLELIKNYSSKITYWVSEAKKGIYGDMNKGIAKATGDYCLFINSGDWLVENGLSAALMQCSGEDIIYFNSYLSYNNSRFDEQTYPSDLTMRSFFKATIGHQSTLIKRDLFTKYGRYNEDKKLHADYEFWIKSIIIENASCKYVDKFLSYYDMGGQSSNSSECTVREINSILAASLPKRVLDDYEYWYVREREMEILNWYKNQRVLYQSLVFIYKVIKSIKRLINR